jgi:hypothetical protein
VRTEALRTCILAHTCFRYVESNEDASLVATGYVVVAGSHRRHRFRRIRRRLEADYEIELSFRLRRRDRRAVRRALERGRHAKAREKLVVTDKAGNARVLRRTVQVVLSCPDATPRCTVPGP